MRCAWTDRQHNLIWWKVSREVCPEIPLQTTCEKVGTGNEAKKVMWLAYLGGPQRI